MDFDITDLRRALARDEMLPSFQPIVGLHTGRLTGFEVLARWQHPELGPILPPNFISMAEAGGLIGELMHQVFRKAMFAARILHEPLMLSVNVSPFQMRDVDLTEDLRVLADESGFALERLMVEITESALLTDMGRAQAIAKELKVMGCRLALDDFGTGYSSLAHLQSLPFDELKVDRSFVSVMTNTRESRKIVAAIVGLAHSLGLATVAEGVEQEEQADMLLWLGCEQGQGWLYGRPVAAEKIVDFITAPPRVITPRTTSPGEGWRTSTLEALPTQRLAQLQAIYHGAPVGLCFLDQNLRYVSMNQRLADMNCISIAKHLGRAVEEVIPEMFPLIQPYLLRALQGEAISGVEVAVPAGDGFAAGRTILLFYHPAWDEADEVIGVSVVVEDITERRRTEEALRESADHQQHLGEMNQQVPWIMDKEGNSIQVSSEWVRAASLGTGLTRHLGWLEPVHLEDLEATMRSMRDALRTGDPIDIKYRVRDIDGEWTWMRSRGSPRLGPGGEILRWYGMVEKLDGPPD